MFVDQPLKINVAGRKGGDRGNGGGTVHVCDVTCVDSVCMWVTDFAKSTVSPMRIT